MSAPAATHLRVRYFRPSWQGGDAEQPLCHVPVNGWAGSSVTRVAMVDDIAKVDCRHCRRDHALGGVAARRTRLLKRLHWPDGEAA